MWHSFVGILRTPSFSPFSVLFSSIYYFIFSIPFLVHTSDRPLHQNFLELNSIHRVPRLYPELLLPISLEMVQESASNMFPKPLFLTPYFENYCWTQQVTFEVDLKERVKERHNRSYLCLHLQIYSMDQGKHFELDSKSFR